MSELFCCEGVSLKFQEVSITGLITINPEVFPISPANASVLSDYVRCNNNRVYIQIGFTITGATNGTCTQTNPVYGSIVGSAVKSKIDSGSLPVRFNDSVIVLIIGTSGGNPCSFNATIEIENAGQIKVKGV